MLLAYREMATRKKVDGLYAVIQDGSGALTIFSYNFKVSIELQKRPHAKIFPHLRDQFTYFGGLLTQMAEIHSFQSKSQLNQVFPDPKVSELISEMGKYFCMRSFLQLNRYLEFVGKNC